MSKPYLFSPSEFAFGYSGCKRCYYDLKVNDVRINFGFPSIFSKIDSIQKKFYHNKPSNYLNSNKVPKGIIKTDYAKLHKSEVLYDQKDRAFQLRGKIDAYIDHKDFFSIIDFKVTNIKGYFVIHSYYSFFLKWRIRYVQVIIIKSCLHILYCIRVF